MANPIDEGPVASPTHALLQATGGPPSAPASSRSEPASQEDTSGRVLVVDDQPEVAQILTADLQAEGLKVVSAASASEALDQLHALGGEEDR